MWKKERKASNRIYRTKDQIPFKFCVKYLLILINLYFNYYNT